MGKKNDSKSENGNSKKRAAKASKADSKQKETKETKGKSDAKTSPSLAKPAVARSGWSRTISLADIELRAYYVAEKRHREGRSGDAHSDWLEAERQLKKERSAKGSVASASATKTKAVAKKPSKKSAK